MYERPEEVEDAEDEEDDDDGQDEDEDEDVVVRIAPNRQAERPPPIVPPAIAEARHVREGPLVLRIDLPARPPILPPAPRPHPGPILGRRQLAAINRVARGEDPAGRNRRRNARRDMDDGRRARRPNANHVPAEVDLQQLENNLIEEARQVLEEVAQGRGHNNPVIGQLLQRPPPAHDNMNAAELLQQREWLERFIELAVNDAEDEWDSEEDDGDDHMWQIPPR